MRNYYNYFTEIEEHFWRRRGAQIYLSPVDWALIAGWQESGIPLEAVLRGIDRAFEKWTEGRRRDAARPRALVYCAPAVLEAAAAGAAACVGATSAVALEAAEAAAFPVERLRAHLAEAQARLTASAALADAPVRGEALAALAELQRGLADGTAPRIEEMERLLTVLDDKLLATLQQTLPAAAQVRVRADVDAELASCRRRLRAEQIQMIERQLLHRRLLEAAGIPRLSLFFMGGA